MTACAMCGDCCRAIAMKRSMTRIVAWARWYRQWDRYLASGGEVRPTQEEHGHNPRTRLDVYFMEKHWHRVGREEAARLLPGMGYKGAYYFTCDAFDPEANLCTAHEERPPICRDFPWYESRPDLEVTRLNPAFRRCSYWADVPRERWPEGIDPLPSPLIQIRRKDA